MKKLCLAAVFCFALVLLPKAAFACCCPPCPCTNCVPADCSATANAIRQNHAEGERQLVGQPTRTGDGNLGRAFGNPNNESWKGYEDNHKYWWYFTFFKEILEAMQDMAAQLSSMGMYQMLMIGTQFDAKEHLETIRDFQQLQARANKDYHPSEEFCALGSNARSLAASDNQTRFNHQALNTIAMERQMGVKHGGAAEPDDDLKTRWAQFVKTYCNPRDNAWSTANVGKPAGNGLEEVCKTGGFNAERLNIDLDFTRQLEERRTIEADFSEDRLFITAQGEDLIALSRYLYGHDPITRTALNEDTIGNKVKEDVGEIYLDLRSFAAKRNVAFNSFNAISAMKLKGSQKEKDAQQLPTAQTMAAVIRQLGMPDDEIGPYLGEEDPSYYAQLEILAKKIYQDPAFFAGLYDKPVNVERRMAAMRAIEMLIDRGIYESRLRQEMLTAVLLSAKLTPHEIEIQGRIDGIQ